MVNKNVKNVSYSIEDIEMIDNNYFYIKGQPNFYCVEIMETKNIHNFYELAKFTQQKINSKQNTSMLSKASYIKRSNNFILYVIYKCDSLKDLKIDTNSIDLAEEKEIISNLHLFQ